jgi:hypothetical protein
MSARFFTETEVPTEDPTVEQLQGYSLVPDSTQPNGLSIRWHRKTLMGPH